MQAKLTPPITPGYGRNLEIKRGETWVQQFCPFAKDETRCGEWCPAFDTVTSGRKTTVFLSCVRNSLMMEATQ